MNQNHPFDKYLNKPKYRFFIQQLLETGLSFSDNEFKTTREGKISTSYYLVPDSEGNVRFYVPDILTGDVEQYTVGQPPHQKIRDWYLTRWIAPKQTKESFAKYTPVKGSGTRCLFTKPVVEAFKSRTEIKTLFVVEGFKKALSAAVSARLPMIGMNGLTGFKDPSEDSNKLRTEIREVLTTCNVQRVVVIFDSDLFELSKHKDKPASQRPNIFYRAALMAKSLFEQFADVVLLHPNQVNNKKYGLDDLLLEHRNISLISSKLDIQFPSPAPKTANGQSRIIKDLIETALHPKQSKYFSAYKLSSLADFKIKQLFHLDNVQSFYTHYRAQLSKYPNLRFKYYTHIYQISGDGTIAETEDDQEKQLNIENRFGKTVRVVGNRTVQLANFTMRVLFQIDSEDEPKRIVEIVNYDGISRIIEITSKAFISISEFRALMINYGNFLFKGSSEDLMDIMTILFKHEKPALQINQLGFQPIDNFYAFSNGIVTGKGFSPVDEHGMVTHNETNYYFPAWSKFNMRDYDTYKDVKKFRHLPAKKTVSFNQWKTQFATVYGHSGEIAICFYISALFSDIIFNHKSGTGFPLLWSAGRPKTGKTTICTSLLSLFGQPSEAIGLAGKSTIKYFINRFAQVRNALVHLDEYSNTKVNKDVKETLKNIYDRVGYGRKAFSNDFRTLNTPILSAAVVSGEEIPTDNNALFTRAILLLFNKDTFTPKEREDFYTLSTMEENGLTNITCELLGYRSLIEEEFDETFTEVFDLFYMHFKNDQVDDRMLKNSAKITTAVKILIDKEKINYGISFNELLKIFFANIERQVNYLHANTDIAKFWDIIEMLIRKKEISEDNGDFSIIENSTIFALRLNRLHIPYVTEARKLGYEKILDKSTLQNYLSNESYYVDHTDSKGKPKKIRFNDNPRSPTSAMYFDLTRMDFLDLGKMTPDPSDRDNSSQANTEPLTAPVPDISKEKQQDLPF